MNTVRSAKDFFFPQTENLMDFKLSGKTIEIVDTRSETEDFVLFGVRACDVKSFEILDRVFLSDPVDTYYKNRREHGIIMSLACSRPQETCFCASFGIDAGAPEGDIVCTESEDTLYLDAKTAKGTALLDLLNTLTEEADGEADAAEMKAVYDTVSARIKKLPLAGLKPDAFGAGKTDEFFNAPEWKELSSHCLGCGTCTFVCPTCQCYDIRDFDTGHGVKPVPLLGFMHVFGIHKNVCGTAASDSNGKVPSAFHAQTGLLSDKQQRTVFVRGMRQVPCKMPDKHEHCESHESSCEAAEP